MQNGSTAVHLSFPITLMIWNAKLTLRVTCKKYQRSEHSLQGIFPPSNSEELLRNIGGRPCWREVSHLASARTAVRDQGPLRSIPLVTSLCVLGRRSLVPRCERF